MSIIITLFALSIVIFIHELGHLLAAKWSKIGVYEFAIGMGPKVISRKWGDTEYSIRLLPIGGFVKLAGMDDAPEDSPFNDSHNLYSKKPFNRFVTLIAGSVFNIILGFLLFTTIFTAFGVHLPSTTVEQIIPNSPAASVLKPGDKILKINGESVGNNGEQFIRILQKTQHVQTPIELEIDRNSEILVQSITPERRGDRSVIGVGFELSKTPQKTGLINGIRWGYLNTQGVIGMVFSSLKMMVTGGVKAEEMAGLVGIVQMASSGYDHGIDNFLKFMAMISISLGVFNLLPLPALDGGHLAFLGIEVLRGKPLNRKWEAVISNTGFALLIALMAFILVNDIIHWTDRTKILNSNSSTR